MSMPIAMREVPRPAELVAPPQRVPCFGDRCMALIEAGGAVLWSSSGLRRRLTPAGTADEGSCCGLLRCAANTGTGEQRCLSRLALADGTGLEPRLWRAADGP